MAFHRDVLQRIDGFDTELGPGKLGFMDDSLFSFRMQEEGFKIVALPQVTVEHHFEPSRLLRRSWLQHGETAGRSIAFVHHHWDHKKVKFPWVQLVIWRCVLELFRLAQRSNDLEAEGCHRYEIRMVQNISFLKQFLIERKRPQKYKRQR